MNLRCSFLRGRKVRTLWDEEAQEWFFSVVDVVAVLTESADPKQYIKKMRSRDPELNSWWGTICTPTRMMASDGKCYNTQAADMQGMFRIIQSIPSPKAEPFKQWMAQVAAQRIDQMLDPELSIDQAVAECEAKGIHGKETTPFLLARVAELTGGNSLASNIRLVYNNAKVAAQTAVEYCKI